MAVAPRAQATMHSRRHICSEGTRCLAWLWSPGRRAWLPALSISMAHENSKEDGDGKPGR